MNRLAPLAAALSLAALVAGTSAASADALLGSYQARMSWKDHEATDGYRLDSAAQVVRQDRANVHGHIQTDEEDDIDVWFTTKAKRVRFEQMLNRPGAMGQATRRAILNGEPLIQVDVYRNSVEVTIID